MPLTACLYHIYQIMPLTGCLYHIYQIMSLTEIRNKNWGTFKHKLCIAVIFYDIMIYVVKFNECLMI